MNSENKYSHHLSSDQLFIQRLDQFLNRSINKAYLVIALIIIPATVSVLYRMVYFGWSAYYLPTIILSLIIPLVYLLRNQLNSRFKAATLVASLMLIVVFGLVFMGLDGSWYYYAVISVLVSMMYFGKKPGMIIFLALLALVVTGMILSRYGLIPVFNITPEFTNSLNRWINTILITIMAVGGFTYLLWDYHEFLKSAVLEATRKDMLEQTIAELTDTQKALEKSEKRFRELFYQHSAAMILINPDSGKIIDANSSAIDFYGLSFEQLTRHSVFMIEGMKQEEIRSYLTQIREGKLNHLELQHAFPDGTTRAIEAYLQTITQDDHDVISAIIHDVTRRKDAEEKLRISEKNLKEANAQKDKFISIMAHDLKNPLSTIIGFSDILKQSGSETSADKQAEYVSMINESAYNLFALLENLLIWSRSQSGVLPFNPMELNIQDLINEVITLVHPTAQLKSITINHEQDSLFPVMADWNMIHTVLRNIITNAIKYTTDGGSITVRTRKLSPEFIEIAISDTGIGIPGDVIPKLFRIDESFSTEGTNNEKGTGLGLILSHDFILRHGGTITVESDEVHGTTFRFTLPGA